MVDLMFQVNYAEEGTNIRPCQERAVIFWRDFLQDCFGMLLISTGFFYRSDILDCCSGPVVL